MVNSVTAGCLTAPTPPNRNFHKVGIATLAALSALPFVSGSAQAHQCPESTSYMKTAQGKCVDLSYLTHLGRSRQQLANASQNYYRAVELNRPRPTATVLVETVGGETSFTQFVSVQTETPTLADRLWQRELLRRSATRLRQVSVDNAETERWASRSHAEAMTLVSRR